MHNNVLAVAAFVGTILFNIYEILADSQAFWVLNSVDKTVD